MPDATLWEPRGFSLKLAMYPTLLNGVLGLECLTLLTVKVVFLDGAAPTFLTSPPSSEPLLSLSEVVEVERDETADMILDT